MDDALKTQVEQVFAELGLSLSAATTVFYKQVVRYGGIPFELRVGDPRSDPFYSAQNQARLQETLDNYTSGKSKPIPKSLEELEAMANV
jgi:DNA-damage-inducible protein J